MSTKQQQGRAKTIKRQLEEACAMPTAFRAALENIEEGIEVDGTDVDGVLDWAESLIPK